MKKILALMLAGCLALSMAACGGEKQPAAEESKTETTEPAATEEKKAEDKAGEDAKKDHQPCYDLRSRHHHRCSSAG